MCIRDSASGVTHGGRSPFADQKTSFKVVGGKGHVLCVSISQRSVQGDDQNASLAGGLEGRADRVVRGRDKDTLGTGGDAVFNGGDLRGGIAVLLTSICLLYTSRCV